MAERRRLSSEAVGEPEWRTALAQTPGATFAQTPEWYAATAPLMRGFSVHVHRLDLPRGPAVLPLWESPARGLRRRIDVQGNSRGLYAGFLRAEPLDAAEARLVGDWLGPRVGDQHVRLNPFQPVPREAWPAFGRVQDESTYVLDVAGGEEAVWAGYASGQRRNVNATRRAGVTCRVASTERDWRAYVDLYAVTLARRGATSTSRYRPEFLQSLRALGPESCQLWLAELDGQLLAGAIHFYHDRHVLAWHAANRLDTGKVYATKLLIHEAAVDAGRRGFVVYDLNVTGGHGGPERWKQLLGARALPAPMLVRQRLSSRLRAWRKHRARAKAARSEVQGPHGTGGRGAAAPADAGPPGAAQDLAADADLAGRTGGS
jgi:hypothetical protein